MPRSSFYVAIASIGLAMIVAATAPHLRVPVAAQARVAIDPDDIGGVVTGPRGPEAGVWVIAESKDLPTTLRKIVVTDDQGRYLVPDLPKGSYSVWVRGYGLVDSPKASAAPGKTLDLTAVIAPNPKAAADYYPALYWLALMRLPPTSDFPGTGPKGNGISPTIKSQGDWIRQLVNSDGCTSCHQLGNKATREIPTSLGTFETSAQAWDPADPDRSGGRRHERAIHAGRAIAGARDVRRLDRSGIEGQAARHGSGAASRPRAERRDHHVGLGGSESVSARRDRNGQAESDRQPKWARVWHARRERRLHARGGSDAQYRDAD